MNKFLLFPLAIFAITSCAYAQNMTIIGKVVSTTDGEPLMGATVVALGTAVGTSFPSI